MLKFIRSTFLEFSEDSVFNFKDSEKCLFKILESQKITAYHPYILYLYEKYENDDERREASLNILERFIVKVQITKDEIYIKNPSLFCEKFIKDLKIGAGTLVQEECNKINNAKLQVEHIMPQEGLSIGKMCLIQMTMGRS